MNRESVGVPGLNNVVPTQVCALASALLPFATVLQTLRHAFLVTVLLSIVAGCDSGEQVPVTMYPDDRIRNISAVDYTSVVASVSFNSAAAQEVAFVSNAPVTVGFSNINLNAPNEYEITWYEVIEGIRLTIASQSGSFDVTSSGTILDSNYSFAFDSNLNGKTNLTEREDGTCPWHACNAQGGLLSPDEVTLITSEAFDFSIAKVGPREWLEVVDGGREFNWILSEYTDTSIFLEDPTREFRFDMNISSGEIFIMDSPQDEFRRLYIMNSVQ